MTTEKQVKANIKNSTLGGVKTEQGKSITKYNATRHGVLTKVLLPEEATEAKVIKEQLINDYMPETLTEELLIENMAVAYVRKERAINAEREYMLEILNPTVWEERVKIPSMIAHLQTPPELFGENEVVITKQGYKAKFTSNQINVMETTFAKYANTCERQFFKALHELQRLQAIRKGQQVLLPTSVDVSIDRNYEE